MATPDTFSASWISSQRSRAQQSAVTVAVAETAESIGRLYVSSSSPSPEREDPRAEPEPARDEFLRSLPSEFVRDVNGLRTQYAAIVNEYAMRITNRQPVEDLYKPAADLLIIAYNLCQQNIKTLGLYALFLAPDVQTEVEAMLRLLFRDALIAEAAFVAEHTDGLALPRPLGSRTLLTGVRGIGKTTILHVVQISVALLSKCMVPVYVNYEEEKKRSSVQRFSAYAINYAEDAGFDTTSMRATPDDIGIVMGSLRTQGAVLIALVDEMQVLYEEQYATVGGFAAAEILSIARRPFENAIVSGSSHSVADLAFKKIVQPWNKGFVNMNNTVYREHRLHPLSKETFAHVARRVGFDHAILDSAYNLSGGVGRDMDAILREGFPQSSAEWFKRFDEEYDKNGLFAHAIAYMYDHHTEEIHIGGLRAIHETMTGNKAAVDESIGMLVDGGILCPVSSNSSSYRLLLPGAFAHIISRNGIRDGLSEKAILAFRSVLNYWDGSGSPGGFCETSVRQWLCSKRPMLGPHRSEYLHIGTPLVLKQGKLADSTTVRAVTSLHQLDGMFGLSRETGIDGFNCKAVAGVTSSAVSLDIDLIQIKLGAVGRAHITAGNDYTGKNADNSGQAKAMIGSVCVGFNKLLEALETSLSFAASSRSTSSPSKLPRPARTTKKPVASAATQTQPNHKISCITFWLVTNKSLNAEARALFTDPASEAIAHFKANCKVPVASVELKLIAGDDFSLGIVPPDAREVIGVTGF